MTKMLSNILILVNKINPPYLESWTPFIKKYYFRINPFLDALNEVRKAKCVPISTVELDKVLASAGFVNIASPDYIINNALKNE